MCISFKLTAKILWPVALLSLASCSSPPPAWNSKTSFSPLEYQNGDNIGGEVVTDAISTTATVVSVDRAKRMIVLKRADDSTITYRALPGALGFDVIQAGDKVKVSVAEELAISLDRNNTTAGGSADVARLRVRMPNGTQAAAAEVATLEFSAKINSINDWDDTVTLQLADGQTKTIKVGEFVNLADVNVGDAVLVKSSEAAVIMLEKL